MSHSAKIAPGSVDSGSVDNRSVTDHLAANGSAAPGSVPGSEPVSEPVSEKVAGEGLRSRKKRETREKLIAVATTLFSERGFDQTTIEAIAERANCSKPTVFNYFPTKRALLHELVVRADQGFARVLERLLDEDASTSERLESFFVGLAERTERTPALAQMLMIEAVKSMSGESPAATSHHFAYTEKALIKLLKDGVRRGDVRSDFSASLQAQMIMGGYVNILLRWLADPDYKVKTRLRQSARFLGEAMQAR